MRLIDENNAFEYLRSRDDFVADELLEVRELPGGISNEVLYVSRSCGEDFVLKQARGQLRVADPWFCSVERVWREVAVMRACHDILASADAIDGITIPAVLWEDRENHLFAMTAAPEHVVWKQQLLGGEADPGIATACGQLLGVLHRGSWHCDAIAEALADRTFFDDLRLDPYYRRVAEVHSDLAEPIARLIASTLAEQHALVHGDFSPKNLLVWDSHLMMVDCEVGHYGDPAFDIGFFLSHLVLKAFHAGNQWAEYLQLVDAFWLAYGGVMQAFLSEDYVALQSRTLHHLGGCLLARMDGKSKIDYLQEPQQETVRAVGRRLLCESLEFQAASDLIRDHLKGSL